MIKRKSIWLLVVSLLLAISCVCNSSLFEVLAPTPETLNAPGVVQIAPARKFNVSSLVWSPDSTRLAISYSRISMGEFSSLPTLFQIQILDINSGEMELIEESERGPRIVRAWLPDNRIAFYASNPVLSNPLQGGMWLMNADGSGPKELVIEGADANWSPNGEQIAFWVWERGQGALPNTLSIYVQKLESGEQHEVFSVKGEYTFEGILRWSPDGNRILFTFGVSAISADDMFSNINIYLLQLATRKVTMLTQGGFHGSASWSPDGKLIAYTYKEEIGANYREALYIMRSDGSCPIVLFDPGDHDVEMVSWSPDGRWIAFEWNRGIYLLDTAKVPAIELLKSSATCP